MEIIKFKGEESDGNLVLASSCAKCGHQAGRVGPRASQTTSRALAELALALERLAGQPLVTRINTLSSGRFARCQ